MKIFLIITCILGLIQIILWASIDWKKPIMEGGLLGSGFSIVMFAIIGVCVYSTTNIPAIDVYRGKTTLQITYQDNIPIDSVVVYKNK